MNLIKFKDSVRTNDSYFNTFLKGKYAYWVHMRYVVPFEVITPTEYIACEQNLENLKPFAGKYIDIFKDKTLTAWVDELETENVNDVQQYQRSNKYTTDPEITIDEVKKFRSWLATQLLLLDQTVSGRQKYSFYDEPFTHVLEYYAHGMYDDTIKWLNQYAGLSLDINNNKMACGCVPTVNELTLNAAGSVGVTGGVTVGVGCGCAGTSATDLTFGMCDCVNLYRRGIKAKMVEYFGDMNFWMQMPTSFLAEFKAYVDNIIRLNLPFANATYTNYEDCLCGKTSGQLAAMEILGRLVRALELIITNDTVGNRNYISDAFLDWARDLYELMEWD